MLSIYKDLHLIWTMVIYLQHSPFAPNPVANYLPEGQGNMGRVTWDPDLRLSLGRSADAQASPAADSSGRGSSVEEEPFSATSTRRLQQQKHEQRCRYYKGQICVCDVTEMQARSIISMAKREMDFKVEKNNRQHQEERQSVQSSSPQGAASRPSSSPALRQLLNPSGLSMKRSLQRFLEKRKTRADEVSPYSHKRPFIFPIKS